MITLNTLAPSLIRTYVPIIVGALVAWLLTLGVNLDAGAQTGLIVFLTGLLQAVYYTLIRLAERQWPQIGVLLGLAKTPDSYSNDQAVPGEVIEDHGILPEYPAADPDLDDVPGRREALR